MRRPVAGDCAEYYFLYIDQVPGDDVLEVLRTEVERTVQQLAGLSEQQALHRYEAGKWSLKEVLGHMVDLERVFGGRALWIARTEGTDLPGMDQDAWAAQAGSDARPLGDLLAEFRHQRLANLHLLCSLDEAAFERRGRASGCEFRLLTIPWILAGHELHHRKVLQERYGVVPLE